MEENDMNKKLLELLNSINRKKAEDLERLNYELNFAKDIVQRLIEAHPNGRLVLHTKFHM